MFPVADPAAFAAALAQRQDVVLDATIKDADGGTLGTLAVDKGTLTVDETAQVRRAVSLTIAIEDPADVPSEPGDLLDPLAGHELWLSYGVLVAGEAVLVPVGVFGLDKPLVHVGPDGYYIALSGSDRSERINRQGWSDTYAIAAGTALATAVQGIIEPRFPGLTYNLAPTDYTVPATTYAPGGGSSGPFADAQKLATGGGMELYLDPTGVVVLRPVVDPNTVAPSLAWTEGEGGTLVQIERTRDTSATYNGVIVLGSGGTTPVRAEAWITTGELSINRPLSEGGMGKVPKVIQSSTVTTDSQAQAAADAHLILVAGASADVVVEAVPDPRADAGDVATVVCERAKVDSPYAASHFTLPLDLSGPMSVTCRPRLSA